MFASRPIPDVVQTALSEPAANEVYKQAKEEALERSKKGKQLYVDWWYVVMMMLEWNGKTLFKQGSRLSTKAGIHWGPVSRYKLFIEITKLYISTKYYRNQFRQFQVPHQ